MKFTFNPPEKDISVQGTTNKQKTRISFKCPSCGKRHSHGWSAEYPPGSYTARIRHCNIINHDSGSVSYWIAEQTSSHVTHNASNALRRYEHTRETTNEGTGQMWGFGDGRRGSHTMSYGNERHTMSYMARSYAVIHEPHHDERM